MFGSVLLGFGSVKTELTEHFYIWLIFMPKIIFFSEKTE